MGFFKFELICGCIKYSFEIPVTRNVQPQQTSNENTPGPGRSDQQLEINITNELRLFVRLGKTIHFSFYQKKSGRVISPC